MIGLYHHSNKTSTSTLKAITEFVFSEFVFLPYTFHKNSKEYIQNKKCLCSSVDCMLYFDCVNAYNKVLFKGSIDFSKQLCTAECGNSHLSILTSSCAPGRKRKREMAYCE